MVGGTSSPVALETKGSVDSFRIGFVVGARTLALEFRLLLPVVVGVLDLFGVTGSSGGDPLSAVSGAFCSLSFSDDRVLGEGGEAERRRDGEEPGFGDSGRGASWSGGTNNSSTRLVNVSSPCGVSHSSILNATVPNILTGKERMS